MGGPFSFAIYNPISMPDSTGEITSSTESFVSQLLTMSVNMYLNSFVVTLFLKMCGCGL